MLKTFKFQNTDGDDCTLEVNTYELTVKIFATTYNYNGEVISRNKCTQKYKTRSLKKLFKLLRYSVGDINRKDYEKYLKFIDKLESDNK